MPLSEHKVLFTPASINGVELRNRFVMPAMQRGAGFIVERTPTDLMIGYLRERGNNGVGLIISEGVSPEHPSGYWQDGVGYLHSDRLKDWERLIHAVKSTGATFLLQLFHPGSLRDVRDGSRYESFDTLSPSGLIQENRPAGRAISIGELEELKQEYVKAALNAQRMGADGVEIHCCHGYFMYQFLWRETNLRTDEYGGDTLVKRSRYPAEVIAAIRAAVGSDFIISFRFSQWAEADYGARIADTPDELGAMLQRIRNAGANCFHASTRRFYKPEWPECHPTLTLAGWTKLLTGETTIGVGSVGLDTDILEDLFDHRDAESKLDRDLIDVARRIESEEFDLISVGRAQIANPDFVSKVRQGALDQIELFRRDVHLREFVEGIEMSAVETSRKIVADD